MTSIATVVGSSALLILAIGCARAEDRDLGRKTLMEAGCTGCHDIPGVGVPGANAGPPLALIGRRAYLAGVLPNSHDNLIRWITRTQEVHPGDAMPSTSLSAPEANAVADFLESLR